MVDSLLRFRSKAEELAAWKRFQLNPRGYGLVTLHRQSNVDDPQVLSEIAAALREIALQIPLLFPVHPRTRIELEKGGHVSELERAGLRLVDPMGYLEFLSLMTQARFILTDLRGYSGGKLDIGSAGFNGASYTERPITLSGGNNRLVGQSKDGILVGLRK